MFWGLIMEPQKRYSQSVKKSFHISHAAMDTATGDNEKCQVMVVVDGQNFLICTLQKGKTIQTPLDLFFREGEVISFITNGKCHIHLTGYLDLDYDDMDGEEEDDEEGESSDEEVPELVEEVNSKKSKRKLEASPEVGHLSKKQKKELKKKELEAKKAQEANSDDSSDDDSVDIQKLLEEDETDEADDSYMPNDVSMEKLAEDDDDDESDDDEDEDDDDESEEEEEKIKPEPSSTKKDKKEKNKQQSTSPQTNGHAEKKHKNKENEQKTQEAKSPVTPQKEKKVLTGNVAIEDLKVGIGATAKAGKMVQVLYEGRLKSNNKMFDSCQKTPGFKFRLGKNEVIKAWDVGVVGMKIGGKRRIVCPPGMAYGNKGSPPLIPPNSTLVFDVELKGVN